MLMFLAIFFVSVVAVLGVQAADIECTAASRRRVGRAAGQAAKAGASFPSNVAGALH